MAQRVLLPVVAALLAAVARALRELTSIRRALARAEERADSLEQYLKSILQAYSPVVAKGASPRTVHLPSRRSRETQAMLEVDAQRGFDKFDFTPLPNGTATCRIDGGSVFLLSRTLATLLEILARDPGRHFGELVDWKSRSEVIAEMEKGLGVPFKVHTIQSQVTRLRKALERQGKTNPYFVQSNPELGWRLALRRKPGV